MFYSQKSYPNTKLGACADTIAQSGCFNVSFCNLLKLLGIADINPIEFNKKAYPNGGCLADAQAWAELYNLTYRKLPQSALCKDACIAETDFYKNKGARQHFFVLRNDLILDPLDYPSVDWKKNPYPIVSYRVFGLKKEPLTDPVDSTKPKEEVMQGVPDATETGKNEIPSVNLSVQSAVKPLSTYTLKNLIMEILRRLIFAKKEQL